MSIIRLKEHLLFTRIDPFESTMEVFMILCMFGGPHYSFCEYHRRCSNWVSWWSWKLNKFLSEFIAKKRNLFDIERKKRKTKSSGIIRVCSMSSLTDG